MTPDVNVLVAASRSDHPHHKIAFSTLSDAIAACAEGASLQLVPMVVANFLRLVTNPKIFIQPMPIEDAITFRDALLVVSRVEMPPLNAEWPIFANCAWTDSWPPTLSPTPGSQPQSFNASSTW